MVNNNREAQPKLSENWAQLSPEQKRQHRMENYLSTEGIHFISPEAEKAYQIRAQRMVDVLNVQEPDQIPVALPVGNLPLEMQGLNSYTMMYEPEKAIEAFTKFNEQYSEELDCFAQTFPFSGSALEILDYKIYSWPGHGMPENASEMQYIEGEYMKEDEYDDLIRDPSDFWLRTYLPRVFGAFEGFSLFQPFTNISENVQVMQLSTLGMPQVQDMLQRLMDAGKEFEKMRQIMGEYYGMGLSHGFPFMGSIFCKAPFDVIGDTLRGTRGIMKDMFRQPDKLLEALDVIADISIHTILKSPNIHTICMVGFPLHKGADGWMSQNQFDTFYWPSLKKVMNAFIQEGLIQRLFAEGSYNTRLDYVNEFPKGMVTWYFDRTDMAKAKEILGGDCCIQGNVPVSLIMTGKPEEVKEHCRKLIETCGKGGGYILAAGSVGINVKMENIRAMLAAVKEYGIYRR
jgi:hypothetical protein